jgi:hypothetical protein
VVADRSTTRPNYLLGGEAGGGSSQSRPRTFISGSDPILPYTDRKLLGDESFRLTNEDMVEAQQRACRGESVDKIAAEMSLPHDAVRRVVAPDVATETKRQETASVGFAHLKRGW